MYCIRSLFLLAIALTLSARPSIAGEGTGSSGGGSVTFLKSGEPKLIDLLSSEEVSAELMDAGEAERIYHSLHPHYLKHIAYYHNGGAFDVEHRNYSLETARKCALSKIKPTLSHEESRFLDQAISPVVYDFQTELPRPRETGYFSLPPIESISPTVAENAQFSVARYNASEMDLDGKLFAQMSAESQCALIVHESVRNINYYGDLYTKLDIKEIEEYTRFIMGQSPRDPQLLSSAKIKMNESRISHFYLLTLKRATEELSKLENLAALYKNHWSREDGSERFNEVLAEVKNELATLVTCFDQDSFYGYSSDVENEFARIIHKLISETDEQLADYTGNDLLHVRQEIAYSLIARRDEYQDSNPKPVMKPRAHHFIMGDIRFDSSKGLPAGMWFNAQNNQVVSRRLP